MYRIGEAEGDGEHHPAERERAAGTQQGGQSTLTLNQTTFRELMLLPPEGQGVRADGREEDGGDVGVDHGPPRGDRVGRAARWRRQHHAVCLHLRAPEQAQRAASRKWLCLTVRIRTGMGPQGGMMPPVVSCSNQCVWTDMVL